jgi:dihydrofolate synthase/folylpolyglutamate synthase
MTDLNNWLAHISSQHEQVIDMGLSRMQDMLQRLDLACPASKVITIAGTNGKGTTATAIEALLLAHGVSVGTTLSPHINRFNERIRISGAQASDAKICAAFAAVEAARKDLPLTYFEFSALAALWCFKDAAVDVAILEIGLGGRLDAFNVVDADIAVITSIGLDHQEYLGDTREQIGSEKAGILRAGQQQVVLGADMPQSVFSACAQLSLVPLQVGADLIINADSKQANWQLEMPGYKFVDIPLGNLPIHNLAIACASLHSIITLNEGCVREVARQGMMPGRLHIMDIQGRICVHDVGHNAAGVNFLWHELQTRSLVPAHIVCCMLNGKDHAQVYKTLAGHSKAPWALVSSHGERALSSHQLAQSMSLSSVPCFDTMQQGLDHALSATSPGSVILLFGSFNCVEQSTWLAQ